MKNPGGKYLIGFRKIKNICQHKSYSVGGNIVCEHLKRPSTAFYCKEKICPVVKSLPEINSK